MNQKKEIRKLRSHLNIEVWPTSNLSRLKLITVKNELANDPGF